MQKTKLQQYQDIQGAVQQEIKTMFPQLFKQYATQYGVNKTPVHTHNGTDMVRINESDLNNNIKYGFGINVQYTGAPETIKMRAIPNMSSVTIVGYAANNMAAPATKRAIYQGHAAFGRCYTFSTTGVTVTPTVTVTGVNIVQGCNSLYTDSTDVSKTRVSFASTQIINIADDTGTTIITMTIDSYDQNIIQLTANITPVNWQLFFSIIMS